MCRQKQRRRRKALGSVPDCSSPRTPRRPGRRLAPAPLRPPAARPPPRCHVSRSSLGASPTRGRVQGRAARPRSARPRPVLSHLDKPAMPPPPHRSATIAATRSSARPRPPRSTPVLAAVAHLQILARERPDWRKIAGRHLPWGARGFAGLHSGGGPPEGAGRGPARGGVLRFSIPRTDKDLQSALPNFQVQQVNF